MRLPWAEPRPIVVYGAGGLGREVEWLLRRLNQQGACWRFEGYVLSDGLRPGPRDSAAQVVGDETWLLGRPDLAVALAIGSPGLRVQIGRRLSAKLGPSAFPTLVDPSAIWDPSSCVIEPGVVVCAGCILTVNVRIERFAFLNLDCTVGHEAVIGEGAVLMPSVNISGGVRLGTGTLVGTGAQILQYHQVGDGATVGAGAVVTKDVPPGITVTGVPAKPLQRSSS